MNFDAVTTKASAGPLLALEPRWSCRIVPYWGKEIGSFYLYTDQSLDADCPWEVAMTLGKIASLDQFSKRLRVAVRASVLWGDLGRDHSIHYTRGILMDLSSKSWIPAARLNTLVGVWKWAEGGEMLLERALHVGTPPSLPRGKAWTLPPYLKVCDGGFLRTTY